MIDPTFSMGGHYARRQTYSDLELEVIDHTFNTAKCDLKPNVISVRI